jgi:glycosyltransferase involved in cell wall biosynthesis
MANGILDTDFVCIFSGGEWARKGLDLAIRSVAGINKPEVKLFVAGDDPDRERFLTLSLQLDLRDRVVFGGFRSDIATALAASDLFLFPSWYEAFSLSTIEAAACGLPIVATEINGTEDFVQPGVTGHLIKHSPEHIASIVSSLSGNRAACRRMGEAARRLVEENYTWDRVAQLTEAAYDEYRGQIQPMSADGMRLG